MKLPTRTQCLMSLLVPLYLASPLASEAQTVIRVPQDKPTVQSAIDASSNGDTVSISPGLYSEQVNFHGKAILVQGIGAGVVLDGSLKGAVVTFNSGETRSSILNNVTVQNGAPRSVPDAGGVLISGASPTITNSIIQLNHDCGIASFLGSPLIQNNIVVGTTVSTAAQGESGCLGPGGPHGGLFGAAIQINQSSSDGLDVQIIGNSIYDNAASSGAIVVEDAGRPLIQNNRVMSNTASSVTGAVWVAGNTAPTIVQNLIVANNLTTISGSTAIDGAGLVLNIVPGSFSNIPSAVTNNTIAGNGIITDRAIDTHAEAQLAIVGYPNQVQVSNNLVVGTSMLPPIVCDFKTTPGAQPPAFNHNDVYGSSALYSRDCTDQTGANGNISSDPLFATQDLTLPYPFQLQLGSLAIDTGNNQALSLPQLDLAGQPRVQNAKERSIATVDMGVYEYKGIPVVLPPPPSTVAFVLTTNISTLTIKTEHHGTVIIVGTPQSSTVGIVSLSCASPIPSYVTCTFRPAQFNLTGGVTKTAQLTVDTSAVLGYAQNGRTFSDIGILVCALLMPLGLLRKRPPMDRCSLLAIAFLLPLIGLFGCSGKLPASTPTGTYILTIVGIDSVNKVSASVPLTLVVTP